jgi:ABC-type dipeptide/oligopeptide/nickel transport system permease subunit
MNEGEKMSAGRSHSLAAEAWRQLRGSWMAMSCIAVLVIFTFTALYGAVAYWRYNIAEAEFPAFLVPVQKLCVRALRADKVLGKIAPYDEQNLDIKYRRPGWVTFQKDGATARKFYLMGTDGLGRDVFLRLVQGARIAFQVGIITSLIAIVLGVILGCLAGYFGGWVDDVVVWLYSTFAAMPSLLFILSIALIVGKGLLGVYLGVGLTTWVRICRLIRGEVMKHKELTYTKAARVLGLSRSRILFKHIFPNVFHIVIINFSLGFPAAIETEVIMSFLGIGVQDQPSWGIMINNARFRLWHGVWWELAFTTLAIFLVVLAFNLLGDALRDALDPRLRTQGDGEKKG